MNEARSRCGNGSLGKKLTGSSVAMMVKKLEGRENYFTWAFSMKVTHIQEGTWSAKTRSLGRWPPSFLISLEKTNYSLVLDAKDAKKAWNKLKKVFQDDGIYRRISSSSILRLESFQTTEAYVDAMVSTSQKLAKMNFAVSDEWLASLLLMGLPKYYAPMVMGMEVSGQALSADAM